MGSYCSEYMQVNEKNFTGKNFKKFDLKIFEIVILMKIGNCLTNTMKLLKIYIRVHMNFLVKNIKQ